MSRPDWEPYLEEHFPAFLLPKAMHAEVPVDVAERFMARLSGRPDQLHLLRLVSVLSPRLAQLRSLVEEWLPDLVRVLRSRTHVEQRRWEGGFQGRLDIKATLGCRLAGRRSSFVTRHRRREFDPPENELVRHVAQRLLDGLLRLRTAGVIASYGWAEDAQDVEGRLRHLLQSTVLREVPVERLTSHHRQAARAARHPCYGFAADWEAWLHEGLDSADPKRMARIVAEGALRPVDAEKRFEIAVCIKLLQEVKTHLEEHSPGEWTLERSIVLPHRKAIGTLLRSDGAKVEVFYDQAALEPGPRTAAVAHYYDVVSRPRPDVTVRVTGPSSEQWALVVEVKHSDDTSYLIRGFEEAMVYAVEHAEVLRRWPRAAVVVPRSLPGAARHDDDVIAVGWSEWPPQAVLSSLLTGI